MPDYSIYIRDLIIASLVVSPIYIGLSVYSFKYYAGRYLAPRHAVQSTLDKLPAPLKMLYSAIIKQLYYDDVRYTPDQWAKSLMTQRVLAAILPFLFVVATIIGGVRMVLRGDSFQIAMYCLYLLIEISALLLAWRFGHKFRYVDVSMS